MRVTSSMMVNSTLRDLSLNLSRLQETQTKMSTGKELTRASVNPGATAAAMGMRQDLRRTDQRMRSLDDANGWLSAADTALTSGLTALGRAKELAVRGANTGGTADPVARQAIASELRSVREEMLALANTAYGDRSVFGGTVAGPAYDATTGAHLGNTASVVRDVAPSTTVTVNVSGPSAFGTTGGPVGSVFEVLDRLATAVENGDDAAIATEQTNLAAATSQLGRAATEVGTRAARLADIAERLATDKQMLTTNLSQVEDVDIVDALIRSKAQETSYQATLQVAAKVLPGSLLDYLR
jgi:flagellar hook-associated protein 3 FlgL